jgi:hypothetical protein
MKKKYVKKKVRCKHWPDSGTYFSGIKSTSAAAAAGKNTNMGIVSEGGKRNGNSRIMNRTISMDGHFSADKQATMTHLRLQGSGGLVGGLNKGGGSGINEFLIDELICVSLLSNIRKFYRSRSLSEVKTSLSTAKAIITHTANYDNGCISPVLFEPHPVRVMRFDDNLLKRCNGYFGNSNAVGTTAMTTAFVKKMRKMCHGSLDKDWHNKPPPPPPSLHNHDLQRMPSTPPPHHDQGQQRCVHASSRLQPTPVFPVNDSAYAKNLQAKHQKHQESGVLAKGVVFLSSLRSRSLS